jgi:hypothetical protein
MPLSVYGPGYVLDDRVVGVRFPAEAKVFFSYPLKPDWLGGRQTASHGRVLVQICKV